MNPFTTFIIIVLAVIAACAVLAALLAWGASNARRAQAIYDGDEGYYFPAHLPRGFTADQGRDMHGHPWAFRWQASDQTGCNHCGQVWDLNDPCPPNCKG